MIPAASAQRNGRNALELRRLLDKLFKRFGHLTYQHLQKCAARIIELIGPRDPPAT